MTVTTTRTPTTTPTARQHPMVRRALVFRDDATRFLARHSITGLRISLGLVFLGFGVLKFFPGASPAQGLAVRTIETLTFGVVNGGTALLMTAIMETFIGITLVSGFALKAGLAVLGAALAGIMSPIVLFVGDMFPGGLPTLEAQYVLKDIILVAAGLVVAARVLGARMVPMGGRDTGATG